MDTFKIKPEDNVAVVLHAEAGIDFGHKVACADISAGQEIIKYGCPIGIASADIKNGEHVHTHNMKTGLKEETIYTYQPVEVTLLPRKAGKFMGFKRKNGKTGIRNEIWVIPTVGCVNPTGEAIARKAREKMCGGIQGIYSFPHPFGCSQLGEDHENTKKILCGLVKHPNAGGVLVLGLGCENNSIAEMKEMLGAVDETRIKFLNCQDVEDEITAGAELIGEIIEAVKDDKREPIDTSELVIGLKCGGSDGLSGITANPLVGVFSDRLIAEGGSAILTEVPEMFGAETILMNRCADVGIFEKTVKLINDFKQYFIKNGQPIYENPSPGNKEGGISTLEDKSLGCTQKAGSAQVNDVLSYGEILHVKGLNLLNSPGNDLVAATALAASGAHIVLFTTGRGTPFGCPVPTVKISSNTRLYERKRAWIDFDAEPVIRGEPMDKTADEFYSYIIKLANGEVFTKTEQNGIRDIAIFKTGVTL
ncbi:MAG: altronate dehydratase family protein [Defluviitaleaceae bacterium]|nr:altronate dehydratase family protein [Defluviitaleaceae bacterium]